MVRLSFIKKPMETKEKAKEFFKKFVSIHSLNNSDAKRCALIAVNEILSMGIMAESGDWNIAKEFWQEVKQEIEKL